MLFAGLDITSIGTGVAAVVAAGGYIWVQIYKMRLEERREIRKEEREAAAEERALTASREREEISASVETIRKQTNHLSQLATEQAALAANKQGRLDERQRADDVADAKEVAIAVVEAEKEENAVIRRLGDPANETIAADIAEVKGAVVDAVKETGKVNLESYKDKDK